MTTGCIVLTWHQISSFSRKVDLRNFIGFNSWNLIGQSRQPFRFSRIFGMQTENCIVYRLSTKLYFLSNWSFLVIYNCTSDQEIIGKSMEIGRASCSKQDNMTGTQ